MFQFTCPAVNPVAGRGRPESVRKRLPLLKVTEIGLRYLQHACPRILLKIFWHGIAMQRVRSLPARVLLDACSAAAFLCPVDSFGIQNCLMSFREGRMWVSAFFGCAVCGLPYFAKEPAFCG